MSDTADANSKAGRANKHSKMAPDAATIHAVQERINELEADQANIDNEFVGAFDDETVESDEQEDEIDQDIVVSLLRPHSHLRQCSRLSLDSPMVWRSNPPSPAMFNSPSTCQYSWRGALFQLSTFTTI